MSILGKVAYLFRRKSKSRGYQELTALNNQNKDWIISVLGEDADVKQNNFLLRNRSRDLWRSNAYMKKYAQELYANVLGENGISMRSKVRETEDRVVHAADEKTVLDLHQQRLDRVHDWIGQKTGHEIRRIYRRWHYNRAEAKIVTGQLDVFANKMIESVWTDWKRAEYCDVRQRRSYTSLCQLRLSSAARDGDHFIRLIRDPGVNRYGFSIQLINSEWVDPWLNRTLDNGNEIRMGIEYQMNPWGLGAPVAFYFIKRHPRDWEYSVQNAFAFVDGVTHMRVDAGDIIHYARTEDADGTRPAPWGASIMPKARQLDAYELAEVIAARTAACKMGFFYSDINPNGGETGDIDPTDMNKRHLNATPGSFEGLEYGVKFQGWDPNHPNGNFDLFRKGMLRSMCAGLPGANYNIIANDAEGVSYSTGRIFSLDDRELWKLLQRFDIETAERPIFEAFLEAALRSKALPLPLAKFTKFNKPHFAGRRWSWVDPAKDAEANKQQLLLGLTSRSRLCDELSTDFDDVLFELAEEEMLIQELGLNAISLESLAQKSGTPAKTESEPSDNGDEEPVTAPAKKPKNGTNGKGRIPALV